MTSRKTPTLAKGFEKELAVLIIMENIFAPVAAIHDVANSPRIGCEAYGLCATVKRKFDFCQAVYQTP
jgi:hypothetical protein